MKAVSELEQNLSNAQKGVETARANLAQAETDLGKATVKGQEVGQRINNLRRFSGRLDLLAEAENCGDPLAGQVIFRPEILADLSRQANQAKSEASRILAARREQLRRSEFNQRKAAELLTQAKEEQQRRRIISF